ncbi:MAG: hypothetical protein SNJ71_00015 [Bacteroidales bacterium]
MITDTMYCLTKATHPDSIRQYFQAVLEKNDAGEAFPIDLDEVWQLEYQRKDHAVRILKDIFIQNVDYQKIPKKGDRGKATDKYYLTIEALEWFVARKNRAVFDVYRHVFHTAIQIMKNEKSLSPIEQYLYQCIGKPLMVSGRPYWPYATILRMCGYRYPSKCLRTMPNVMFQINGPAPAFVREYGRVWADATIYSLVANRRVAYVEWKNHKTVSLF